ncbi:DUF2274 domain-containing protein [Bradyrhizobium cenepequi]
MLLPASRLIAPMLARFMSADRAFVRHGEKVTS